MKFFNKTINIFSLVFFIWIASSLSVNAQVTVDNTTTNTTIAASTSFTHTTGTNSNRLMLVGISHDPDNVEIVSSVSYNGIALNLVGIANHTDRAFVYIYSLIAPPSGSHSVVVSFDVAPLDGAVIGVTTYSGVDQTNPLGAFTGNSGSSSTLSLNISSATDELVFAVSELKEVSATPLAGQTNLWNNEISLKAWGSGAIKTGATSTTIGWTQAGTNDWAIAGIAIKPGGMILNTLITNESCTGSANGAIDLTVTGNSGTTTYAWTGLNGFAASTEDISGLIAGTYNVTVTDDNGSETTLVTVNISSTPLVLSNAVTYLSTTGTSDGAIDLTVSGGTPTYSFSWTKDGSPFATTEDLSGLSAGLYEVTVTDFCLQTATTSVLMFFNENPAIAQKYLYLTGATQGLDRTDPADGATIDNTNSRTAELTPITSVTGIVADNFDTDGSYAGNNSVGVLDWSTDWIASGSNFIVTSNKLQYSLLALENLYREADLSTATAATLSYDLVTAALNHNLDDFVVEISYDGGASYTLIETIDKGTTPHTTNYTLTSFTSNTRIRLRSVGGFANAASILEFDNVSIAYTATVVPNTTEIFTQGTAMCGSLTILAGESVTVETYATITAGAMPASPDVDALLQYGSTPTTIIDLSGVTPTWDGSKFTWTGTLPSDVTIPAGEAVSLLITSNEPSVAFTIEYDGATTPSNIQMATSTYISIDAYDFYDAAYSGGSIITENIIGETVYLRTTVSDPFGASDITGLDFTITDPVAGVTTVAATEVATVGCAKTYEYAWTIPTIGGDYSIQSIAHEGTEGVTYKSTKTFTGIIPYTITKTISSPATGPYTINDNITYTISIENSGPNPIAGLPLQDIFDAACFEYVSATTAPTSVVGGNISWDNVGPLAGTTTLDIDVVLNVIGNCDPATNLAKVEGATDESGNILETKSDSVDINIDEAPVVEEDIFCVSGTETIDVLANDSDADGDMTTLSIISAPASGTATVVGTQISFNPSGMTEDQMVTFTYQICDNASPTPLCSEITTVTVNYSATNNPPTLGNDVVSTTINAPITISVLANDTDTEGALDISTLAIIGGPAYGAATVNTDGTIHYAPTLGYIGTDQITYRIYDNGCPGTAFSTATVDITIIYANYVCSDGSSTLSLAAVPDADSYVWTLPAGANPSSGTITTDPTISVDWSGVSPGQYTICVAPTNDCGPGTEQCIELVINELILAATEVDILCNGENTGEIDLTVVGGVAPYTYAWSNLATIEDLRGLPAGIYDVTVTDINGCTATATGITISEPSTGVSITGTTLAEDPYGSSNGSIDITPFGGTSGYSYLWSNGATTQDIIGLSGGSYNVTVMDTKGCSTVQSFTVNTNGGPLEVSSIIATDVLCNGDSTGTIVLEIIGGSGTYTYDWDNDGTGDFDDPEDLTALPVGTYNVTIRDGVNPDITANATVNQPATALSLNVSKTDVLCNGASTGAVDLTVTGGTAPYTYTWSNGEASEDISNLLAGTYDVTVTDVNGCTKTINDTIIEPVLLEVTGVLTEAVCGAGGAIDITPTGGPVAGNYAYLWSNGATTQDVSGLAAGTYNVTVTDDNGCLRTETYTVESACIDVVKTVIGTPVNNKDGTYSLVYNISVENNGSGDLNDVQIVEDLNTVYPSGFTIDVVNIISQPASGDLTLNGAFDGNATNTLLAASSTLVAGESILISLELTVTPGTILTSTNTASVSATSVDLTNVTDSDTASVTFTETPSMAVTKTISGSPINNNDGMYTLTYRIKVENTGDVVLNDVQVVDDLNSTFSGLTLSSVSAVEVTDPPSTDWTINTGYEGLTAGDTDLLSGSNSLNVGEYGEIDITVTVAINGSLGAFTNTADASATSPANTNVTGTDATAIIFTENPEIGLAKALNVNPVNNGDGTYTLSYQLRVENTGDVPLNNVQVNDDLTTTFSGLTLSAISTSIVTHPASTTLAANGSYDGSASSGLLSGSPNTLNVGEFSILQVNVTLQLNGSLGPFDNSATATGTGPGGTTDTDISENGTDVDPEGDGPENNSTPTPVTFTENPSIGIAKTVSADPTNNNDGTYTLTYTVLVENTGDVNLSAVQATDNLSATFTGATLTVDSVTSSTFTTNSSFDGSTDLNLLTAVDGLIVGASGTINITVTVTPGTNLGAYNNSATANANSPGNTLVTDDSWNGTVVDPDNDGDPTNNDLSTPVIFTESPQIGLAKTIISGPTETGPGTGMYTMTYEIRVENAGDVPLNNIQIFEDLTTTFSAATGYSVNTYTITQQPANTTLTTNGTYDGGTNTQLLNGSDTLMAGEFAVLQLAITVTPGSVGGPYDNSAVGLADSPGGITVVDVSEDGTAVDPDNDGLTSDNNTPTPAIFFENPNIGLAKDVFSVTDNGDGTNTVTFLLTLENFGDVALNDLIIHDNIVTQFAAVNPTNLSVSQGTLFVNATWDGTTASNILEDGQSLNVGEVGTVYVSFTIAPVVSSLDNLASAEGTGPLGGITTDISTDGLDPDGTNNDGNPDENVPTTVTFLLVYDYGDALSSYGDANHLIVSGYHIGSADPDAETQTQNTANGGTDGLGDNNTGIDDETTAIPILIKGKTAVFTIPIAGVGGYLQGWIDFDGDGAFSGSEQIAIDVQDGGIDDTDGVVNGTIQLAVTIPANAVIVPTFARLRWSTDSGLDATSLASNGEVEDYQVTIKVATVITNRRITYRVKKS